MRDFFKNFLKENRDQILGFSLLRLMSFGQVLFWPYAFAKVVDILSQGPENREKVLVWTGLMIINKVTEDFVRLRAKFGLDKIRADLKISLATFFSEQTNIRDGQKTGEAVQTIKKASQNIYSLVGFYKNRALQLPVNIIVIPLVLAGTNTQYLLILLGYGFLYLTIDYYAVKLYWKKLKKYFKAAEVFWGTTYRKTPEVWRKREDNAKFAKTVEKEGQDLYQATVRAKNINNWRWTFLQALSSMSLGGVVLLIVYKVLTGTAPVGDLILVSAYFKRTQSTLNIISAAAAKLIQTRTSLRRVNQAVSIEKK